MLKRSIKILLVLLIVFGSLNSYAFQRPKWEIGFSNFYGQLPHYTGSNHYYQRSINLPYIVYRSNSADLSGEPKLFNDFNLNRRIELGFAAELPVESDRMNEKSSDVNEGLPKKIIRDKNHTRRGMEDIQALLGIGLKFKWYFGENFSASIPILSKNTFGGGFEHRGNSISPGFAVDIFDRDSNYEFVFGVTWEFGDKNFNQTYYEVKPSQEIDGRKSYKAKAGMISRNEFIEATAQLSKHLRLFGLYYWRKLNSSVIASSPLVKTMLNEGWVIGVIIPIFVSEDSVSRMK